MSITLTGRRDDLRDEPKQPRRSRLPNRRLIATTAAIAVSGGAVVWLIAFSPVLGVRNVVVHGERTLRSGQITAAAAVPRNRPLVRVDTAAIERRVDAIAGVASSRVRVSFPNSVVITVVERRAVGYVQAGSGYVLVDRTGTQFRSVSRPPAGLPLFAVPAGLDAKPTGAAVASVAASLPHALLAEVASIQAFDPTAITLLLTDQRVVRWGSAYRNGDKAQVLRTLLKQPGSQFDVTNPDLVVAR